MATTKLEATDSRMRRAGAEAFTLGRPCVPGLDPLWTRELSRILNRKPTDLSKHWRLGWRHQAELAKRFNRRGPR